MRRFQGYLQQGKRTSGRRSNPVSRQKMCQIGHNAVRKAYWNLGVLCQGAASIVGHAGIGIGSRQRLIGMAGMLQLASMSGMLQLVSMPEEHATCMTMIAKLLSTVESHSWPRI
jgi:hypothetical protein